MAAARYAIYYVPGEDDALGGFGRRWFGQDDGGADDSGGARIAGFSRERLDALTASARTYGFHATLKAPFRLRKGTSAEELSAALQALAQRWPPVRVPPLRLTTIGSFLALTPRERAREAGRLAATCVRAFERFRAPPSPAALLRRRAAGLRPCEAALLARWGYPYVMEQFRFHLTLSDPIGDSAQRKAIRQRLLPLVAPFSRAPPLRIEHICLCRQDEPGRMFVIQERFCLSGSDGFREGCAESRQAGRPFPDRRDSC